MDAVTSMVADRPVVIFSRTTCCMSHTIKTLISGFGANPTVYELDGIENGQQIERELQQMGCKPSVAAVFIGKQLIGGAPSNSGTSLPHCSKGLELYGFEHHPCY